jgi:ATP-binding cassette subfamily B multidrug efflux pump
MPGPMRENRQVAKSKNMVKTLKRVFEYMAECKIRFIIVVLAILCDSLTLVANTSLLKRVIDTYIEPLFNNYEESLLYGFIKILLLMAALYLLGVISVFVYTRIMVDISTKTLYKIRVDLFTKLEALPIKYFDTHTHGELMSRFTNDTDAIRQMLNNSITNFISSATIIAGVFVMMLVYSWQLTILVIVLLAVIMKVTKLIGGKSGLYFGMQQKELGKVNGYIEEMFEGQKVVKVFCHEEKSKKNFDKLNDELCEAATSANTYANMLMPVMANLSYIHYAITAIIGGILAFYNIITLGTVVAFLQLTKSFSRPITQMSQQINAVMTALAGAERIFAVIDEKPEVDEGYVTLVNAHIDEKGIITEAKEYTGIWAWKHPHKSNNTITYTQLNGAVEMNQVVFGYEENKVVLNGISLYAKPGQKIALVGSTGAGKTTITNLINRFYDVPDGKISYDGININKIKKEDLRRSLGMVLQDTHLFTGTVMDNIRYGKLDASDEEVIAAAELANAASFIHHLPQGYQTLLTSDGANLSQGQRQLIAIARAAVADPPVLILDEATSSIDTRTEALIEKGMDHLMEGRTVFVIAHRLSTVHNAEAIMVLENGKIIERGSHDDLITQKGKYYQLYTGMFELS